MGKTKNSKANAKRQGFSKWRIFLAFAIIIGAGLWWMFGAAAVGYGRVGASYMAHTACSCRYLGGRSLESCKTDKLAGMELISLSEDAHAKSVTARFPLLASETAQYKKGYGCVLEKWEE